MIRIPCLQRRRWPKRATCPNSLAAPGRHPVALRRVSSPALFFVLAVVLVYAVIHSSGLLAFTSLARWEPTRITSIGDLTEADLVNGVHPVTGDIILERILNKASMKNKTVILTTVNDAWASPGSLLDIFLECFRHGPETNLLLKHLVIISFDLIAHRRCMNIHKHCFALENNGTNLSGEEEFMTKGYLTMMWRRIDFLRLVLEKGYNFIFSDADVLWFRNPLPHFYSEGDLQFACDHYVPDATDLRSTPNGGFVYVKSSNRTVEFYKFWYNSRVTFPGYHDQDVLSFIKHDPYLDDIGVTIRFLNTTYFGGICEPSRNLSKVCTMHANCCVGLKSKLHDLRVMIDVWKNYSSLSPRLKGSGIMPWRVPQNCSVPHLNA